jgi:hypothetical protein
MLPHSESVSITLAAGPHASSQRVCPSLGLARTEVAYDTPSYHRMSAESVQLISARNSLTTRGRVLPEKLTVARLLNKLPTFHSNLQVVCAPSQINTAHTLKHNSASRSILTMKSYVFRDITSCSPVKVNRRFGGTHRLYLPPDFMLVSCSAYFSALKMEAVPPKRRLTLNGLHGVISQKVVLFITTAVRTSKPAC